MRRNMNLRAAFAGVALAAGIAAASAAKAETVFLDVGVMTNARSVNISGIGKVNAAPVQFKTIYGGQNLDLVAWCVDVYHSISMKDYKPDLEYVDTNELTHDFSKTQNPLDAGDERKVGLLVHYGQSLFEDTPVAPAAFTQAKPSRWQYPNGSAGTSQYNAALASYNAAKGSYDTQLAAYNAAVAARNTTLSAVQGAIWQVVSNRDVTSVKSDAVFDKLVDDLSGDNLTNFFAGNYAQGMAYKLITPVQQYGGKNGTTPLSLTQSFAFAEAPEPGTWLLMISGFGLAGAALRRQRAATA